MDLVDYLQEELERRKQKNPRYSLRAFARGLGIQSSSLSGYLKRNRAIPMWDQGRIAQHLRLPPRLQESLFSSSHSTVSTEAQYWQRPVVMPELTQKEFLLEWEYLAVMSLVKVHNFKADPEWIGKRLGITVARAHQVLELLLHSQLIAVGENDKYVCQWDELRTTDDVTSMVVQEAHQRTLAMAQKKLKEVDVAQRDYSSLTLSVNPKNIKKLKSDIRQFLVSVENKYEKAPTSEVYRLCLQLFPLTEFGSDEMIEEKES